MKQLIFSSCGYETDKILPERNVSETVQKKKREPILMTMEEDVNY